MSKVIELYQEIECHGDFPETAIQHQLREILQAKHAKPEPEIVAQDACEIEDWT